jgi:hypothetical protein
VFDIKPSSLDTIFPGTDGRRYSSPGYVTQFTKMQDLGDNCIVFENFTASIGDLMVAN